MLGRTGSSKLDMNNDASRADNTHLKHSQEQMFLTALVLVSIDCEHDCLQERVDLCHGHKPAKVRNVSGLGLQ